MSIELPEATILAAQMDEALRGKQIIACRLQDYERLQRIGMLNKDLAVFDRLVTGTIDAVVSRGKVIRVQLNNHMNLLLGPEYGGQVFYHARVGATPRKFHLKVEFRDGTALTVRLTSMGVILALNDDDLDSSYLYQRDFNMQVPSPLDADFTPGRFAQLLTENTRQLKAVLVGKDAVVVGLSNSAFQDILYRARLHPKRRASALTPEEQRSLYDAVQRVLRERLRLQGKDQFADLYGNQGGYTPAMGPNMKAQTCPACGMLVAKLRVGGGHVYFCPTCQL
jgi:formamidopyrimidine-DNA glycosylase